jgi:TPR repeat protein
LEKAAGQGHAYAMNTLGDVHDERKEHERAVEWFTKAAEAGLPLAQFNLGCSLDNGEGVAAPDYPAAVDWFKRAADGGSGEAANNLSNMYTIGRGRASTSLPATSSVTFAPSFLDLNGVLQRGQHYLPGARVRRHA